MAKSKFGIVEIIVIIVALLLIVFSLKMGGLFVITGNEIITRTAPSTVAPNAQFTVTYTASQISGDWGATVVETITGGCTINGKTTLQFVMLSDLPNPLTYTAQAPSSGTCTFTGDYQFGDTPIKQFENSVVSISGICTPTTCS